MAIIAVPVALLVTIVVGARELVAATAAALMAAVLLIGTCERGRYPFTAAATTTAAAAARAAIRFGPYHGETQTHPTVLRLVVCG